MSKKTELTRRKVLGGLAGIGVASAAAGAGTMAYFSDQESTTGNTVSAGTLELDLSGNDTDDITLGVSGKAPGDSGNASQTILNNGTLPGYLDLKLTGISRSTGDTPEAEPAETTSGDGDSMGDLGEYLSVKVGFDNNDDGTYDFVAFDDYVSNLSAPSTQSWGTQIAAGGTSNLRIEWSIDSTATNVIQDDGVTLGFEVQLEQQASQT